MAKVDKAAKKQAEKIVKQNPKQAKQVKQQVKQAKQPHVAPPPKVVKKQPLPPALKPERVPVDGPKKKPPVVVDQHKLLPTKIKRLPRRGGYNPSHHYLGEYAPLIFLFSGLLFLAWYFFRRFARVGGRLPPGPIGTPLFGVANQLQKTSAGTNGTSVLAPAPYKTFTEWGKKYGNIYSFYNGPSQLVVVLNDYETIKEAFVNQADVFVGRPRNLVQRELSNNGYGVGVAEGDFWRDQRRFLLRAFHGVTAPNSLFEQLCIEEALSLSEIIRQYGSTAFDPRNDIELSAANVMFALCYGRRLDRQASLLRKFVDNSLALGDLSVQCGPMDAFPMLRHTKPYNARYSRLLEVAAEQRRLMAPEIARMRAAYESNDGEVVLQHEKEPTCLVDYYLAQRVKLKNPDASRMFCMDNVLTTLQVTFLDGFEPVATTILWALVYLLRHPHMQQKLYTELSENNRSNNPKSASAAANNDQLRDDVVGYGDRASLPYAEAFLNEVLRRGNTVPLGIPRRTLSDVKLGNYFIPQNTTVIANIWAVQNAPGSGGAGVGGGVADQSLRVFKPERFLVGGESAKKIPAGQSPKPDSATFIPFGVGKRSCAGESVARMQLFVMIMNLVKICDFRQPAYREMPSDAKGLQMGATLRPAPFEVVAKLRGVQSGNNDGVGGLSQSSSVQQDL